MIEQPLASDQRFGCYLISDSSRYSDIARAVECAVFQEFFGNEPHIMCEAYAPYETHSMFLLVVDSESQQPAGTLRVIAHSEDGLKTLNDVAQPPLSLPISRVLDFHGVDNLERCWDVGTLAVLKHYRGRATGHLLSTMLYGLFHAEVCRSGIEHVVTILDEHAHRQLTQMLAVPFVPIVDSQAFNYLGSEKSRAVYLHVPRAVAAMEAHLEKLDANVRELLQPYMFRVMYGEGLPEVVAVR